MNIDVANTLEKLLTLVEGLSLDIEELDQGRHVRINKLELTKWGNIFSVLFDELDELEAHTAHWFDNEHSMEFLDKLDNVTTLVKSLYIIYIAYATEHGIR